MTTIEEIERNKTSTLKRDQKVIMVNCGEADHHKDVIWNCATPSFIQSGSELVFLHGFSGSFLTKYLKPV